MDCSATSAALTALGLTATSGTTTDGVPFTLWSGKVASWDGVPLAVDVTMPMSNSCTFPLISLNTGMGGDRTAYESTDVAGKSSLPWTYHWNNAWFASNGIATLTFTPRGLGDSCGKSVSTDGTPAGLPTECTQEGRHYWFQFADARYDVRDLQWLFGRLVDAGAADPTRLAVSGGSLGGGLAWLTAILNDRTACGGAGWDQTAYGPDPCSGAGSGLIPWVSPGGVPLSIRAAVPEFAWASLSEILLPNGRRSDGTATSPPAGPAQSPIGVPVQKWLTTLQGIGAANGFFAPDSSGDTASAWGRWYDELQQQVNTVSAAGSTPLGADLKQATTEWDRYKSPASSAFMPSARVPIVQVQGLDDSIIPPVQAKEMVDKVTQFASDYPIATVYGDLGHAPAANPADTVHPIIDGLDQFIAYELLGHGTQPTYTTDSHLTRCINPSARPVDVEAPTYAALATSSTRLTSSKAKTTRNSGGGTEATTSAADGSAVRCAHLTSQTDAGVAAWSWKIGSTAVIDGSPTITAQLRDSAQDAELNARLWDVTPSGTQYLISRGTYRLDLPASSTDSTISFQIPTAAWSVASGDTLKLELTGYDAPTFQSDAIVNTTTVDSVKLDLPTTNVAAAGSGAAVSAAVGHSVTAPVAQFPGPSTVRATSYAATIDWGDGTSSAGSVASDGRGHFTVTGSHTWSASGSYVTRVRLSTPAGPLVMFDGTATVT